MRLWGLQKQTLRPTTIKPLPRGPSQNPVLHHCKAPQLCHSPCGTGPAAAASPRSLFEMQSQTPSYTQKIRICILTKRGREISLGEEKSCIKISSPWLTTSCWRARPLLDIGWNLSLFFLITPAAIDKLSQLTCTS